MPEQNNDFYIQRKLQIFVTFPYVTNRQVVRMQKTHKKIYMFYFFFWQSPEDNYLFCFVLVLIHMIF